MADQKRRRRGDDPDERSQGGTRVRRRGPRTDDRSGDQPDAAERPRRQRARRQGSADDDRSRDDSRPRGRPRDRGPRGAQLAQRARRELAEITGLEAESVTSLVQADDGTWKVTVELLELARIPDSDDVLGSYEVQLDEDGELLGYERVERYARSQSGRQDRRGA